MAGRVDVDRKCGVLVCGLQVLKGLRSTSGMGRVEEVPPYSPVSAENDLSIHASVKKQTTLVYLPSQSER